MEAIDNLTVVLIPNAMDAGLGDALFYGSIAGGFAIAYPFLDGDDEGPGG